MRYPSVRPVHLIQPRNLHWQMIADQLMPDEREHWCAMAGANQYDAEVAATGFINTPGARFVLVDNHGHPIMGGGAVNLRGGCWDLWMSCTPSAWANHWRSVTKSCRWLIGQVFENGGTRVQITTLLSRTNATDWYQKALGMSCDGILRQAGSHGEDLVMYSLTNSGVTR